jgi:1-phosphatidylinositol phosphodiesterase
MLSQRDNGTCFAGKRWYSPAQMRYFGRQHAHVHTMKSITRGLFGLLIAAAPFSGWAGATNWMSLLNPNLSLAQLSIPGTHDSGARYEPVPGTAKCQDLTLEEQLNAGVRFLDIRCRHINDAFAIHHGFVYQNLNFDDVLGAVIGFLNANPGECVIMSVKEEYDATGNTRAFEQTFDSYVARNPGKWYLQPALPTLGQVRRQIVLFRRFQASAKPKGIDASSWPNSTTFSSGVLRVQDNYSVSANDTKWNCFKAMLNEADHGGAGTLYVNFASGVQSILGIPNILLVSNDINSRLTSYFTSNTLGRYGIIVLDFADATKCALIYNTLPPH